MKRLLWSLIVCCALGLPMTPSKAAESQTPLVAAVDAPDERGDVTVVDANTVAHVYVDAADEKVVSIASQLLVDDVNRVTGRRPELTHATDGLKKTAILIGTIGKSAVIDKLIAERKIDVDQVRGQWETFLIQTVEQPLPGVDRAVVIVGSDRRGTAYGALELSQQIGVSPWYWWADVTPTHRDRVVVKAGSRRIGPPSVKYRGIFINDEDWGLQPWAAKTFEPDLGNIGPKTYEKVFELLLRLKGNYLWPAMHKVSTEFGSIDRNVTLADEWGIVMGASHCEPMNRNNVWWNTERDGPWRYDTNRPNMIRYWEEWAQKRGKFEAVWTVGMRGIHDSAMAGPSDIGEQVKLLEQAIADQRELITKHIAPDCTTVPQVFMPYKEALAHYQHGLKLPDDVTILWCEDNFGYIRQLSTTQEQQRRGASGVYYHISYLGRPMPYLWLNTTPPALIWAEMSKAAAFGADRIWVLNVGDIKPGEVGIDFWMRLAWDTNHYGPDAQDVFLREWASREFGSDLAPDIAAMMNEYYRLGFERKPEQMRQGVFEPVHYDEANQRLAACVSLREHAEQLAKRVPPEKRDAFFELVLYPVRMLSLTNQSFLAKDLDKVYALQGRASASDMLEASASARKEIDSETAAYNETLAGGKWRAIMTATGISGRYQLDWPTTAPTTAPATLAGEPHMGIVVEGQAIPIEPIPGSIGVDIDARAADAVLRSPWVLKRGADTEYLVVPNGTGDVRKAGAGATAEFKVEVPADGQYNLFALVDCPTDKDDSWFVRVDDGDWQLWADQGTDGRWLWCRQSGYALTKGSHTISLGQREDGAMVSRLRLTTSNSAPRLDELYPSENPNALPPFDEPGQRHWVDVFDSSKRSFDLEVQADVPWLKITNGSGRVDQDRRIWIEADASTLPKDAEAHGTITFRGAGSVQVVEVSARPSIHGTHGNGFIERDGYLSIEAEHFTRSVAKADAAWISVGHLGRSGDAVTIQPANATSRTDAADVKGRSPSLEYDIDVTHSGAVKLQAYCLPTHRINSEHGLRYAVSIDDDAPTIVDFDESGGGGGEMSAKWQANVSGNIAVTSTTHQLARAGKHVVKLWMVDPGVVVDKLVLDLGGLKPSELGPPETRVQP